MKKTLLAFFLSRYLLILLPLLAAIVSFQPVLAQKATPSDDEVNAIARQLFCPICENTPLDVCPTDACRDWRELIRQMLSQGKTAGEIKQYFVDHYGARVLSEPPRAGLSWFVYVVPPVAFLIGVVLLFRAFRIWKGKPTISEIASEEGSQDHQVDDYASRLEEEIRKREQ
jgi:cytochrome c-type biogenesis protein CcmH